MTAALCPACGADVPAATPSALPTSGAGAATTTGLTAEERAVIGWLRMGKSVRSPAEMAETVCAAAERLDRGLAAATRLAEHHKDAANWADRELADPQGESA